jgi:hypothetical protein
LSENSSVESATGEIKIWILPKVNCAAIPDRRGFSPPPTPSSASPGTPTPPSA